MIIFYCPDIEHASAVLPEAEARHAIQVLRKRIGDRLRFMDGEGGWYEGEIIEAGKKICRLRIIEEWRDPAPPVVVDLVIAPTKNINRIEWLLEKATEIGVDRVHFVETENSERKQIRLDRLEKVVLAAGKQSLRAHLPKLHPMQSLNDFLKQLPPKGLEQRFIAYIDESVNVHLKDNYLPGQDVVILVGPEGGFSKEEVQLAGQFDFIPVSLGNRRLRTETAGLVAIHTVQLLNE